MNVTVTDNRMTLYDNVIVTVYLLLAWDGGKVKSALFGISNGTLFSLGEGNTNLARGFFIKTLMQLNRYY